MGLVAKRVADKRLLRLIRGFLTAGVLDGGLVGPTTKGTPQGGPLSPLLSNLMLDVLDKKLETRGNYVRSRRAGERVMASVTDFLARRLKLTVNAAKSAVDRPSARTASSAHGPWRISQSPALSIALPNAFFDRIGLASVAAGHAA